MLFPSSNLYTSSLSSYYSGQECELKPACIIQPKSAVQVASAVSILAGHGVPDNVREGCRFAVRSGGTAAFAGSANIAGGVTIDLGSMNQVTINADRTLTAVGPGARWSDVYGKLDPMGLSVLGGRFGRVGVAGLLTGGES